MNGPAPCRLVLVRHGETDWNATGRWQGHGGAGLNRLGGEQAAATAGFLASTREGVAFLARSDLQRVAETAAPIEARLAVGVRVDPRLRELDCGSWTGHTHAEIADTEPDAYEAWQRGEDVAPGGGERVADMQTRVTAALREYLDALAGGETAVVVTHGGPIRVGVAGLLGRRVTRLHDACDPVANCAITVVAAAGGGVEVERYGDLDHLDGLTSVPAAGGPL